MTVLCVASFYKGWKFLEELARLGCHIVLVTTQEVYNEPWPACVNERFCVHKIDNFEEVRKAVGYLARSRDFGAILPIDEYVVDICAQLREHFRIPGIGVSDAARFRDKLLMRIEADKAGVPVPAFSAVLPHSRLKEFCRQVPAPWILKPRAESGSVKMRKLENERELWAAVEELGDDQSHYLVERFVKGNILHVDGVVWKGKLVFSSAHRYGKTPFSIWRDGGVFSSRTIEKKDPTYARVHKLNEELIKALRLEHGVTHAEYIEAEDGSIYFLEIAARVGGAHIDALVKETRGVDLWVEWARVELAAAAGKPYKVKASKDLQGGLFVCLTRQKTPDLSEYDDEEVTWSHVWDYHLAMTVASKDSKRVDRLLEAYQHRFADDFLAIGTGGDRPA
ncbi:MAG: ATP-grasp domain-containing protein [Candidatus Eremiobacteraeota bacterium]|nr:ATP-grasp domain-containing protein [Candidatus Eremiobacteraeota bacterium]MCW5869230.1 ATP-grasp domain-containing protein [Candidatus Eremiobacteraeota bacterium]